MHVVVVHFCYFEDLFALPFQLVIGNVFLKRKLFRGGRWGREMIVVLLYFLTYEYYLGLTALILCFWSEWGIL